MPLNEKYLICVVGPTAVGKTAMAIQLAQQFQTEIISADSRQFYKELSIGTAVPSPEELATVPHHFIQHLSVTTRYSAGDFERDALQLLEQLFQTHDMVILVGGSGMYVKALVDGLDAMPTANEPLRDELRNLFESEGILGLQERLKQTGSNLYHTTELQNPQRVMRAIEIAEQGERVSLPRVPRFFKTIPIGLELPREILYERINTRVDHMVAAGLEQEARQQLPNRNTYALQTVGYKEWYACFDGNISRVQAIDQIKQHTRNYAKRQLTWFKRDPQTRWFAPDAVDVICSNIQSEIVN